ncbi:transposase, partial [Candidatus Acetothermia bacterium]|nr:transposase [Candidatus Acetothermia bacterium]
MNQRRKFTPAFKAQVVLEVLSGTKSPTQACRAYGLKDSVLSRWKQQFMERVPQLF